MKKSKLLLAEDDSNLGQILQEYLEIKGFETTLAKDGEAGIQAFFSANFDLCILDLMMPKKDGFTMASEIRAINSDIPIIFLTAKSMKEDVIRGFKIGADDYVTKPFSMEELLHRIHAVLRRTNVTNDFADTFQIGDLTYIYEQNILRIKDNEIKLTTKENELLRIFLENLNKTVGRSLALKRIWKDDSYFNARSMDVYITKLRKYLKEEPRMQLMTIHGEGFKLIYTD
jgi:DNA-binding response OmpR family regulator